MFLWRPTNDGSNAFLSFIRSADYDESMARCIAGVITAKQTPETLNRLYSLSVDQKKDLIKQAIPIVYEQCQKIINSAITGAIVALALPVLICALGGNLLWCLVFAVPMALVGFVLGGCYEIYYSGSKEPLVEIPQLDPYLARPTDVINPASGVVR